MTPTSTALRWMWIWITLGVLIVAVVVGFLFGIANGLESADEGLGSTRNSVRGANGDVHPLPVYVEEINTTLGRVDLALRPVPGQASEIERTLASIHGTLRRVHGSLSDTSGALRVTSGTLVATGGLLAGTKSNLVNTSGSLGDTSSVLSDVSGGLSQIETLAARIAGVLDFTQSRPNLGTNAIWRHVRFLNGGSYNDGGRANRHGLRSIRKSADGTLASLREINKHLTSICHALPPRPGGTQPDRC